MSKINWLVIQPMDTLFFRGSEPMEAGENHQVDTMFPPAPSTIIGAIRTTILSQNNIGFKNLANWHKYPILGTPAKAGFTLVGPLFQLHGEPLFPVPASWYADLPVPFANTEYPVQNAHPLDIDQLQFSGSVANPFWVHNPKGQDMKPLNGFFATRQAFAKVAQKKSVIFCNESDQLKPKQAAILPASCLCDREERVGIALTAQRTAKEGHLYSAIHIRLKPDVGILAGISSGHNLALKKEDILQLGGEQRVCRYTITTDLRLPQAANSKNHLALSPVALADLPNELASCPRASGKLLHFGGWDLQKNFHKPMTAWLPAGTVFYEPDIAVQDQYILI